MDDQERVEELGKGFNQEKRPSQTSEDISWTFLERKSAENSPKPPKIAVNSHLLSLPGYDAEPEMSDGISVISEGEGHHTPPGLESDSPAATPDAADAPKEKKHFSFDAIRITSAAKRSGYRPMTPPQTPPTEEEEGDDEHEAAADKKNKLASVQTNQMQPKKPKQKMDLESFAQDGEARRFIGIYPRHVVFLMVVCGIIGGMIGHLWNLNYGCNCDAKNQQLVDMYNQVVAEKWTLQEMLIKYDGQGNDGAAAGGTAEPEERRPKLQPKPPTKWTGHEDNDEFVTVEDEPETTSAPAHKPIPTDQFEALIWDHLREPQKRADKKNADEMLAELRSKQSTEEAYARALLEKRQRDKDHGGHSKNKRSTEDTRRDSGESDSHERKAKEVWTKKKQDSGEKYHKYPTKSASSREAKYQGQGKYEKRGGSGSGEGAGKFRGRDSGEEESREGDKKSRNYDKKYQQKRPSGEWSDKRNRGRDEQRQQQRQERAGEKNWYLERGREREIDRIETMAA